MQKTQPHREIGLSCKNYKTIFRPAGVYELEYFDTTTQPMGTVVLSCPRMDLKKLWALLVQHPWFEDWYEEILSSGENA